MVILDQHSRYVEVHCIREKSEALSRYQIYCNKAHTLHDRKIKFLRADGGGEFNSLAFLNFLDGQGTTFERTMPYSSRENPIVERMNKDLNEHGTMLSPLCQYAYPVLA